MDEIKLAFLILAFAVLVLTIGLVLSNYRIAKYADKSLEHCMAFHDDQREYMRIRFDTEHQEFLLREARSRQRPKYGVPHEMQPDEPPNPPHIPIESDTQS